MINYKTDLEFHYDVLEMLARRLRPTIYVGLGISAAHCIRRVAAYCQRAIGVDMKPVKSDGEFEFFQGTTEQFAAELLPTLPAIEMAFIDADHKFEASLRDFEMLLPSMAVDGLLLLHDTYPEDESWLVDENCSECFRTADHIYRNAHAYGVESVTIPAPPGLTLVRKRTHQMAWEPQSPGSI